MASTYLNASETVNFQNLINNMFDNLVVSLVKGITNAKMTKKMNIFFLTFYGNTHFTVFFQLNDKLHFKTKKDQFKNKIIE